MKEGAADMGMILPRVAKRDRRRSALNRADLERVQRTCASVLEPVLLFVLKRARWHGPRRNTPLLNHVRLEPSQQGTAGGP